MSRKSPLINIKQHTYNSKKLLDNILIVRADASNMIGIGHVMRCIALAQAWKRRGGEVFFIGRISSDKLKHRIVNDGFEFIAAEHPHPYPNDIYYTLSIIDGIIKKHHKKLSINCGGEGAKDHWIVLDGYYFGSDYQRKLQNTGCFLLVIDDLAHLPHYYADILLNLAAVYMQITKYDAAHIALQKILHTHPDRADAWYMLGLYYRNAHRLKDALRVFRTAIEKNVNLPAPYDRYREVAEELGCRVEHPVTDFVFYASGIRFDGSTIQHSSLGGSESALYYMARLLAGEGYSVRVFNRCEQPGTYDGVEYAELVDYHIFKRFNRCRVFISSRSFVPLYDQPDTDQLCLWLHDTPAVWQFEEEQPEKIDWSRVLILTLSEWHTQVWMKTLSLGRDNFFITQNGFDPETFQNLPAERDRNKLMYTSRPVRACHRRHNQSGTAESPAGLL